MTASAALMITTSAMMASAIIMRGRLIVGLAMVPSGAAARVGVAVATAAPADFAAALPLGVLVVVR